MNMVAVVMIYIKMWGEIEFSVPQDINCAQGHSMGMTLRIAAWGDGSVSKDEAKPGEGDVSDCM